MAEKQSYDSDLIGWVDEPKYYENKLSSWRISLSAAQIADLPKYQTEKGNVYITLRMSKTGKPLGQIYNPRSEKAQAEAVNHKANTGGNDDLPF